MLGLYPEGMTGLSLGFQPQVPTKKDPSALKGRQITVSQAAD
jgi:hypothetical protein